MTIELEGIVTVHCDENQSPEILRDQMIFVVATIIWIVFKLQAAIAQRSTDKVVVAVPLTQIQQAPSFPSPQISSKPSPLPFSATLMR